MPHSSRSREFVEFFRAATGFEPYPWQLDAAKKILAMERGVGSGLLFLRAETGSGKTEAVVIPGLYAGRQVLVVEPFRAIVEDLAERLARVLERLSWRYGAPYSLAIDYGGGVHMLECREGYCQEVRTLKPFGADIYITTMDELLYRLLSVEREERVERKASLYTALARLGTPLAFFDEAHSYASDIEEGNALVTVVHEAVSLALYSPVVIASATLPEAVEAHLRALAKLNRLPAWELRAPPREKRYSKARVVVDMSRGVDTIAGHAVGLLKRFRTVLVRVIRPEAAYEVYSRLAKVLGRSSAPARIGVIHGRMPVLDRAEVFRHLKRDMAEGGERVVLVATTAIEAGVDLDFDAAVVELAPYRSLEQTLGRVNRHYTKERAEVVIVDVEDRDWHILGGGGEYLEKARDTLRKYAGAPTPRWEDISGELKELDERYTREELSTAALVDAYSSPYSRLLAASLHSLFHLGGTLIDYIVAIGREEYKTRERLSIIAEVEGEPGNYIRIPKWLAEKMGIKNGDKIPRSMLKDHSYIRIDHSGTETIARAHGLILNSNSATLINPQTHNHMELKRSEIIRKD